ncbi:transposase [Richelia sinica FACHB-800]|uniref:Transposase n=1 Tax=Richelia sinica FACHB-800 TaxID=1357546 RepID=A0A975T8B1_9NOST|nr:transposase [Richelia sinica FACHB-800]
MTEVVRARSKTKVKTGRPGKLRIEDQLLMALEYWREYRTYFHSVKQKICKMSID